MKKMISIFTLVFSLSGAFAQEEENYSTNTTDDETEVEAQSEESAEESVQTPKLYSVQSLSASSAASEDTLESNFRFGIYVHPISLLLFPTLENGGLNLYLDFEIKLGSRLTLLATPFVGNSSSDDNDIFEFGANVGPRFYFSKKDGGHRGWYAMAQLFFTVASETVYGRDEEESGFGLGTFEAIGYMKRFGGISMSIDAGVGFGSYGSTQYSRESKLRNGAMTIFDMNITLGYSGF